MAYRTRSVGLSTSSLRARSNGRADEHDDRSPSPGPTPRDRRSARRSSPSPAAACRRAGTSRGSRGSSRRRAGAGRRPRPRRSARRPPAPAPNVIPPCVSVGPSSMHRTRLPFTCVASPSMVTTLRVRRTAAVGLHRACACATASTASGPAISTLLITMHVGSAEVDLAGEVARSRAPDAADRSASPRRRGGRTASRCCRRPRTGRRTPPPPARGSRRSRPRRRRRVPSSMCDSYSSRSSKVHSCTVEVVVAWRSAARPAGRGRRRASGGAPRRPAARPRAARGPGSASSGSCRSRCGPRVTATTGTGDGDHRLARAEEPEVGAGGERSRARHGPTCS